MTARARHAELSPVDQEQAGDKVAIPFGEPEDGCPTKKLREWLAAAKVTQVESTVTTK